MEGHKAAKAMFNKYDDDGNENLDYTEFSEAHKNEFDTTGTGKASRPFKTFDVDKNKKLSCEEFTAFYCE